jgi:hypothetical protein
VARFEGEFDVRGILSAARATDQLKPIDLGRSALTKSKKSVISAMEAALKQVKDEDEEDEGGGGCNQYRRGK